MAASEVECFSGDKTAHNSQTEGWIEKTKTWKCEAEGRRCAWGNLTSRKTRRMHSEAAPDMASLPWSQNNRKENATRTKVSTRGLGSSWSYLCANNTRLQLACLVIIQGGCSACSPKISQKWARLVWFPRYHSFPKWAIVGDKRSQQS